MRISAILSLGALPHVSKSANPTYDYVIMGGGTAGLLLANRLSADPSTTVAVIEPGTDQRNNIAVTDPTRFGQAIRSSIDWAYQSIPQPQMGNRVLKFSAGLGIGGSSLINAMAYIRGDKAQFDSWEQLGNPGWNWDAIQSRAIAVEKFFTPTSTQVANGATYVSEDHGTDGPLHVGFSNTLTGGPVFDAVNTTWHTLGMSHTADFNGGDTRGFSARPCTLDPVQNYRWDSATAFWWPVIQSRPNLKLIQGQGSSIIWKSGSGTRTASGVRYHNKGATLLLNVNKEVILAAGALRSPIILEHSGVGNATLLQKLGIQSVIDLPGVGATFNDQPSNSISYQANFTNTNATTYATFVNAKDIFGSKFDSLAASTKQAIPSWATQMSGGDPSVAATLQPWLQAQHDLMFKSLVTIGEIQTTTSNKAVGVNYWNLLPFSHGSVHTRSSTDWQNTTIDPGWFRIDFDTTVQTAIGRYAKKLWETAPASDHVVARTNPTKATLPDGATDAQWESFHRGQASTPDHAMGTLSMRSKNLGGAVDSKLVVYGTKNVRVADASVIPMQFSGHPSVIVYAVAQRAAEIILGQ